MRRLWLQIERLAAWLLLPLILLQFLSGYAILHWRLFAGIMSKPTAFMLHSNIQPLTIGVFVIHGFSRLRNGLARCGVRNRWLDGALAITGAGLVSFSIYLRVLG